MKNLIKILLVALTLASCVNSKKEIIIDVSSIIGKNKTEIEKILGKPDNVEMIRPSNTPCVNVPCEKVNYQSDKFEIVFINDKSDWITINKVSEFEINNENIELLGLELSEPSIYNHGNVTRWNNIENIKEISIFDNGSGKMDYIYIKSITE
ncbi:hypothetical protein ACM55H_03620 [Flavobacterium sp. ZT3R17]|uniref:hypothetical protein n=1 Tax=Flavobacterium cryoconiti TaxID=3398736 RepID=UPI003A840DB4